MLIKETPLMAERNLNFYTCTTSGKSTKSFTRKPCYPISSRNLMKSCALLAFVINAGILYSICLTELYCKQLCWFPECVGKNILNFVHSLVAFPYSNICHRFVCVVSSPTQHKNYNKIVLYLSHHLKSNCEICFIKIIPVFF